MIRNSAENLAAKPRLGVRVSQTHQCGQKIVQQIAGSVVEKTAGILLEVRWLVKNERRPI